MECWAAFSRFLKKSLLTWRFSIILLAFCAISIHAVLRNALNVSSVCMLRKHGKNISSETNVSVASVNISLTGTIFIFLNFSHRKIWYYT